MRYCTLYQNKLRRNYFLYFSFSPETIEELLSSFVVKEFDVELFLFLESYWNAKRSCENPKEIVGNQVGSTAASAMGARAEGGPEFPRIILSKS